MASTFSPNQYNNAMNLADLAVDNAARDDGIIAPRAVIEDILRQLPSPNVSVGALENEIVTRAAVMGVAVSFG